MIGRSALPLAPGARPSPVFTCASLLASLALLCATSSCTILYLFNSDPAGLPCDFTNSDTGECLDGYVCSESVCVKRGAFNENDPCTITEQCDDGLVCASGYQAQCEAEPDNLNCSKARDEDKELRCRPACDRNTAAADCGSDQRCFDFTDGSPGFCQIGTCATDSDCGADGLCGDAFLGGISGLCQERCEPLACDRIGLSCPSCTGLDGAVDVGVDCRPIAGEVLSGRTVCTAIDTSAPIPFFGDCSAGGECAFGSFCAISGNGAVCSPWCSPGGGAPACDGGGPCDQVPGTSLGVCR